VLFAASGMCSALAASMWGGGTGRGAGCGGRGQRTQSILHFNELAMGVLAGIGPASH
jgi:hypothetical protein